MFILLLVSLEDGCVNKRFGVCITNCQSRQSFFKCFLEYGNGEADNPVLVVSSPGIDKHLLLCDSRKVCHVFCHQSN